MVQVVFLRSKIPDCLWKLIFIPYFPSYSPREWTSIWSSDGLATVQNRQASGSSQLVTKPPTMWLDACFLDQKVLNHSSPTQDTQIRPHIECLILEFTLLIFKRTRLNYLLCRSLPAIVIYELVVLVVLRKPCQPSRLEKISIPPASLHKPALSWAISITVTFLKYKTGF